MKNTEQYRSMTGLHRKLPVFYQPWWLDASCSNWDVILFHDADVIGIWPFQKEKKLFFSLIRTPLLTPYLQPLLINDKRDEFISNNEASYKKFLSLLPRYSFLQFQTIPGRDISFFKSNLLFRHLQRVTYFIRLQDSIETIFSKISEKRRNDIRKAERDLSVTATSMPLQLFTELHIQTFHKKGVAYRYPSGFIEKIVNAASKHNAAVCLIAKDSREETHAILWAVYDEHTMYYLLSTTSQNKHRGAVSLLIWNAIIDAKKKGLKIFDFEGSMDPGIAHFFKKFGGEEQAYFSASRTPSLLWRIKQYLAG